MATLNHHRPHRLLLDTQSSKPPTNGTGNRMRSSFTIDTNMVIILAALLSALICVLGLNSIVRCAMRCSRRFGFENPADETAAARLGASATGLKKKKSTLCQIPVAIYSSGIINMKATDCPICLGEFMDGEKIRVLPKCNHGFHVRCIDTWLLLSHSSCPTCRQSLLEQPTSSDAAAPEIEAGIRQHGSSSGGQADVPVAADEVG